MRNLSIWQKFLILLGVVCAIGLIIAIQAAMAVIGYVLAFAIIIYLIFKFGFKSNKTETPE